uniref:Plastid-encoded RNA polymerase subunit alpha n=1 Tax=Boodleopsis pusilla TaxID=381415 RepID=A0A386AZE2_9CHLO|nr:RNA polymerase a-subunit [Boodleopsis pusilla]AYC64814.1 RNA polymerase a-subunit [Boodleopsis pusilla]
MHEKNFYCVSSRVENNGQFYGCFKIGPFFEHQSYTFANTLRRTLLADQSRCTFQAVQIYGVTHEFANLGGIRESIVDLLLNLEKIVFQTKQPLTKPQIAFIHAHGPMILRAKDIYLPPDWQCVRPDQYIATLEVDGQLLIKLFFSPNFSSFDLPVSLSTTQKWSYHRNRFQAKLQLPLPVKRMKYLSPSFFQSIHHHRWKSWTIHPFEQIWKDSFIQKNPSTKKKLAFKKEIFHKQENNFLFLKSSLCAIEKVNYTLQTENQHNRQLSFSDPHSIHRRFPTTSIFFEVWTDGSVHPQRAIFKALKNILLEIFSYILESTQSEKIPSLKKNEITKLSNPQFQEKFLNMEIGNFYLDIDTYIFLKKKKIYKILDFYYFFQNENWESIPPLLKKTLYKFHFFINSILVDRESGKINI